ncbi:MAG: glycosyltransferase family 9 protein [Bacteroidota bacterium]|nr:glycosyltransferase family 9 protein [Bacteroidota bacterium]
MKKFLIIRFSSIGDIVLTTPVIRCLRKKFPDAEIHFLTKHKNASILKANPYLDKLYLIEKSISEVLEELKKEAYHHIIDLQNNFRSFKIKFFLRSPSRTFDKLNLLEWLLVSFKINKLPKDHIVDRYMKTIHPFHVKNDLKGLDYFIPEDEEYDFSRLPDFFKNGYVAFVLSGTYFTKRFPEHKIIAVCNQLNLPFILLGGKSEIQIGIKVKRHTGSNVINLCGSLTINQSASIIKNAEMVITNDTGMMHVASALRKKILSFWGSTVPEFGMTPYLPHPASKMLQVKGLDCRPCSKLGSKRCPMGHFYCMNKIKINEIAQWITHNYPA